MGFAQKTTMLLLLLASQLASPSPIAMDRWFSWQDYPSEVRDSLKTDFEPVTQTLVGATGKIIGCRVETPSSSPKMDALACALILKRARFEPARWSDGAAVPGVFRLPVAFYVYGDEHEHHSDIELEVGKLPNNKKSEYVEVAFSSDAAGKILECVAKRPVGSWDKPANPMLVPIACKAVQAEWKPFTVLGDDGKPSRSVQNAIVKFVSAARR